ncbi:MAG: GTPase Era [Actinobacteria bacterium]|nr:GTPase Era [Actinomycetota bacterium]
MPNPKTPDAFKSGFVVLVGRPNTGKSTLLNALVGKKVSIVSDRPQTTRTRLRAIIDRPDAQVVIVDTPGIHKPMDALGGELNKTALRAVSDADVVCFVVDGSQPVGRGDEWIARHIAASTEPHRILLVTKADLVDQATVERQIASARKFLSFDEVLVVSAVEGFNLEAFLEVVIRALPEGPRYFPPDMESDQSIETTIAEFIREKIIRATFDEVPHAIGVVVEEYLPATERSVAKIAAIIYVERDSQKGILIGKGGETIKKMGIDARLDLERLLAEKVYLDLRVKVKPNWRRDPIQIRRLGYGDGGD